MNGRRCLVCGDPLDRNSRAERLTCSDRCRKRLSLARGSENGAAARAKAPAAAATAATVDLPNRSLSVKTEAHSRE